MYKEIRHVLFDKFERLGKGSVTFRNFEVHRQTSRLLENLDQITQKKTLEDSRGATTIVSFG